MAEREASQKGAAELRKREAEARAGEAAEVAEVAMEKAKERASQKRAGFN